MRPLTIGLDARAALEEPAGRGQVVREFVAELARRSDPHRYLLYLRDPWEGPRDPRFEQVLIGARDPLWHVRAARHANRRCDVFLDTNSYLLAWFLRLPTALIVYDLVAFMPETFPQPRAARIERATIGRALRRARVIFAISESTRDDLVERHPEVEQRTRVVHVAASPAFRAPVAESRIGAALERHGLDRPFVLSVGTIEPRKNIVRLIRAWSQLADEVRGSRVLALVGRRGWELEPILSELEAHRDTVAMVGYVDEDDLVCLYHACDAFCYPSLYEGFGLPIHEALCCGAAVLTSNRSSMPEVAGDAAVLVDPLDERAIASGLERLLTDDGLRERLRAAAPAHAARFNWALSTEAILDGLEELAGGASSLRPR